MNLRFVCVVITLFPFAALAQQSFNQAPAQYQSAPPAQQQAAYHANNQQPPQQSGAYNQIPQQGNYSMPQQDSGYAQPSLSNAPNPQGNSMGGYNGAQPNGGMSGMMNAFQAGLQTETQDFGVAPQSQLRTELHGPTPTSIPGGQTITTDRLMMLYQQGQQNGLLVFDVLGSDFHLPMAQNAIKASEPGSFNDGVQREFGQYLQQVSQGNKARPMVFYCQGTSCWMSYNAALRAIQLGYNQVYWYRGGVEAWQRMQQMAASMPQQPMGGQQQMPASGNYPQNGQNPYMGNR